MTRVWVLYSEGVGGRNQLEGLARHLGWPYEMKYLRFRRQPLLRSLLRGGADLLDVQSDPVREPWPDLVLTMGRDATAFALALKRNAGGTMRIVKIGRPMLMAGGVDLWIQTDQFPKIPWRRNVTIGLPFHLVTADRLAEAARVFAQQVEALPRPRVAVLAGGITGSFEWSAGVAGRFATDVNARVERSGGSILLSTSKRTGRAAERAIADHMTVPNLSHFWAQSNGPNPYMAWLALADLVVVTEDSVSMIAEACATGKPVEVFPLPPAAKPLGGLSRLLGFGREKQLTSLLRQGRIAWFNPDSAVATTAAAGRDVIQLPDDHRTAIAAIRAMMG